jgi:hypothetical protein
MGVFMWSDGVYGILIGVDGVFTDAPEIEWRYWIPDAGVGGKYDCWPAAVGTGCC